MTETTMKLEYIDIDQIRPNPFQPREHFEKESLQELANSIRNGGVIQPIVVRRHGANFEIIAGERRWRATRMADVKRIPAIVKDVSEDRVLIESLVENLHRLDLSDPERENAVHELWEKRDASKIKTKSELAKSIGLREDNVSADLDAWQARHVAGMPVTVSTRTLDRTRGLEPEVRKRIAEKVDEGNLKATEVDVVVKLMRKAPETIRRELLKSKSHLTPKMAETIVEKLPSKEDQEEVVKEVVQLRLTDDEVEARVHDIKRSREEGKSPAVDRQIIVQGQWLVDRIRNPVNDLISINPDAFSDLDDRQRIEVLNMLTKLQNRLGEWIRQLRGAKVLDTG